MADLTVPALLVGLTDRTFKDGTQTVSMEVRIDGGETVTFWANDSVGAAMRELRDAPMGTPVTLTIQVGAFNGKAQLRLVGVAVAKRAA